MKVADEAASKLCDETQRRPSEGRIGELVVCGPFDDERERGAHRGLRHQLTDTGPVGRRGSADGAERGHRRLRWAILTPPEGIAQDRP
jgi:hypothetical protein